MRAIFQKNMDQWFVWADESSQPSVEHDSGVCLSDFSRAPHAQLVCSTSGNPFQLVHICLGGSGLEAMRVVMGRCGPTTLGTKRAVLETVFTTPSSSRADEMERHLLKVEELMKKYDLFAGDRLGEHVWVTVIIGLCVKGLQCRLEVANKRVKYAKLWEETMSFIESHRASPSVIETPSMDPDQWTSTTTRPTTPTPLTTSSSELTLTGLISRSDGGP